MFSRNRRKKFVLAPSTFDDGDGDRGSSSSSSDNEETQLSFQSTERQSTTAKKQRKTIDIRKIRVGDQVARKMSVPRKLGRNSSLKRKMTTATTTTTTTKKKPPLEAATTGRLNRPPSVAPEYDDTDDSVMDDSDMDVPYTQNLGLFDDAVLALELSDRKKEPLRPGDVILYNHPVFVAGSKESIRVTQVLSTDPDQRMPLSLANGEFLPADTYVRRIKEYKNGALIEHPGISRPIENFRFGKRALTKKDESGLSGFENQVDRLREIILSGREEMKTFPQEINANTNTNSGSGKGSGGDSSSDTEACDTPPPKRMTRTKRTLPVGDCSSDSEDSETPLPKRKSLTKKTLAVEDSSSDSETPLPKRKAPTRSALPADSSSDSDSEKSSLPLNQLPANLLSRNKKPSIPGTGSLAAKRNLGLDTDSDDSSVGSLLGTNQRHGNRAAKDAPSMHRPPRVASARDVTFVPDGKSPKRAPGFSLGLSLSKINGQERPHGDRDAPSSSRTASIQRPPPAPNARSSPFSLRNHAKKAPPPPARSTAPPPARSTASLAEGGSLIKKNSRGTAIPNPSSDWLSDGDDDRFSSVPQKHRTSTTRKMNKYGLQIPISSQKGTTAPSTKKSTEWYSATARPRSSSSKDRSEDTGTKPRTDLRFEDFLDGPVASTHNVDLIDSPESGGRSPSIPQKHRTSNARKIRKLGLKNLPSPQKDNAPSSSSHLKDRSETMGARSSIDLSSQESSLDGPVFASKYSSVDLTASPGSDGQSPARPPQKHHARHTRTGQHTRFKNLHSKKANATTKGKSSLASTTTSNRMKRPSVFRPTGLESDSCQDNYADFDSSEDENRHSNHRGPTSARLKEDRGYSSISSNFPSSQSSQEVGKTANKKTPRDQGRRSALGSSSARTSGGSMQLAFTNLARSGSRFD
jgi:hypothetical protein